MAKICPRCNLIYDDKLNFCQNCGVPLVIPAQNYVYQQQMQNPYYQQQPKTHTYFVPFRIVLGIISIILSAMILIEMFSLYQRAVDLLWVDGANEVMTEGLAGTIQQLMAIGAAVCIFISCRNHKCLFINISLFLYLCSLCICYVIDYEYAYDAYDYRYIAIILIFLTFSLSAIQAYENKNI